MVVHLERDLETLKKNILNLGNKVEKAINNAIKALVDRRPDLAEDVLDSDQEIDTSEVEIEEDCLKILALHQPVAKDLRFIISVLKVNNELERMGDQAANIALRARFLAENDPIQTPIDFNTMVESVQEMVHESLEALVNQDPERARAVTDMDEAVNTAHQTMFEGIQDTMAENPDTIERAIHTLLCSRYLERIGDLAKNISEDVIFLVEGKVLRHQLADSGEIDLD
jgi:phosphate transport system protein